MNPKDPKEAERVSKLPHLNYATSLSTGLIDFNPKSIAVHALIAMIKVAAQLKDLRRGHTSQGLVKRIEIDQTSEGYANFMADGRMKLIAHDAERAATDFKEYLDKNPKRQRDLEGALNDDTIDDVEDPQERLLLSRVKDASHIYSREVLKPKQDTYLTASWDEMVPFPTSKTLSSPLLNAAEHS